MECFFDSMQDTGKKGQLFSFYKKVWIMGLDKGCSRSELPSLLVSQAFQASLAHPANSATITHLSHISSQLQAKNCTHNTSKPPHMTFALADSQA